MSDLRTAAERLRMAASSGIPCAPIRELIGESDLEKAYAIQDINNEFRMSTGAKVVGSKIGLTSIAVQKQLGVDQPDYGLLFNDMEVANGLEMDYNLLIQPKVEAEIAFVLGKDLEHGKFGAADMMSAIDYAVASIEIVGSRVENWDIKITDTIADNASASHFVLGHKPVRLENFDLINCQMQLSLNGTIASEGVGSACFGSPLNAVTWLAKTMSRLGRPMKKGQVILSGALGPMVPVNPGDHVTAEISGLGHVSVKFSK